MNSQNSLMNAFFTVLCVTAMTLASTDNLLVKLSDGSQVQGHALASGANEWTGIRYAKSPEGDLRWEAPQTPPPLSEPGGTYIADFVAPGCPQQCNLPYGSCPDKQSEDCLYLSVWAPSEPSSDPAGYPVFFWIHGGAFTQGAGSTAVYNATHLVDKDVVSVVINYRLGALGYMASESMTGNYGVMDQIKALQWTSDNIAGFGGDPERITIAGQSAGSESTLTLVTSEDTKGLIHQAIIESNPLALPAHSRASAAKNAKAVFEYLDCDADDVECMRSKPADAIVVAQKEAPTLDLHNLFINFQTFSPMVDPNQGPVRRQPFYDFQDGNFPPMNLMAGTVSEEGWLFVMELFTKPMGKVAYDGTIRMLFGSRSIKKEVLDMYPYDLVNKDEDDGRNVLNVLATDLLFFCPLRNATRGFQQNQAKAADPIYLYRFAQVIAEDIWEPSNPYCVGYVCHGSELPFVFNIWTDGKDITYDITDEEDALQQSMISAWANFMHNGNPNQGDSIMGPMPEYAQGEDTVGLLQSPGWTTVSNYRNEQCDMWDRLGYYW